ncbi:hypothetical protein [Rugosimonospora acidiphila]|uniref:hypothetical protein n=1 Tax=Rugosimonospora acidiphila TaxID=556531 RepID=UPI0031E5A1CE
MVTSLEAPVIWVPTFALERIAPPSITMSDESSIATATAAPPETPSLPRGASVSIAGNSGLLDSSRATGAPPAR